MLKKFLVILALFLFAFTGCLNPQAGEVPFYVPHERTLKMRIGGGALAVAVYVDVERHNPLNAGDYFLEDGTPFFNFVILGAAQMRHLPDGRRVTLYLPPGLRHVLNNRRTYIEPLQRMGIRVLLGITGGQDDVTFGNIRRPEDDIDINLPNMNFFPMDFAETISGFIAFYHLDGVELIDTNAARIPHNMVTFPYPDGSFEGFPDMGLYHDDPDGATTAWLHGGQQMSFLTLLIRLHEHMISLFDRMIIIREVNFGAYISAEPATFEDRSMYVNYFINNDFAYFGSTRANREDPDRLSIIPGIDNDYAAYGPLSIDLGGITPPLYNTEGNNIVRFSEKLRDDPRRFRIMFYNGLMPSSEEDDRFNDTRPASPTFGQQLTQADIMSVTSEMLFGQRVTRAEGAGNHQRTW